MIEPVANEMYYASCVGIFDQTYSCWTRVVHEVLTLYTLPLTVGWTSVELVIPYHIPQRIN